MHTIFNFSNKAYLCLLIVFITILSFFVSGCSNVSSEIASYPVAKTYKPIGIVNFMNHTSSPLVGKQASSITLSLLHIYGFNRIVSYKFNKREQENNFLLGNMLSKNKIFRWARMYGLSYVLLGSVNEWSYKIGFEGEPAVGITLQLFDVNRQRLIWSAVGSKSGSSNSTITSTGQKLISQLLRDMINDKKVY